jgi:hypothetical protein
MIVKMKKTGALLLSTPMQRNDTVETPLLCS